MSKCMSKEFASLESTCVSPQPFAVISSFSTRVHRRLSEALLAYIYKCAWRSLTRDYVLLNECIVL